MTPPPRRSRNPKGEGERLRHDIIEAAVALIGEHGPEGLSLRAIARKAGVTAPAIYGHFDDLDGVRRAVIDSAFADFAAYLRRHGTDHQNPADRLRALCRAYTEYGIAHPQQYAVMFGPLAKPPNQEVAGSFIDMAGGEAFTLLLDAIRVCADAGASNSTQPYDDAIAVWVALHGYVGLHTCMSDIPWPDGDTLLDTIVERLAQLS